MFAQGLVPGVTWKQGNSSPFPMGCPMQISIQWGYISVNYQWAVDCWCLVGYSGLHSIMYYHLIKLIKHWQNFPDEIARWWKATMSFNLCRQESVVELWDSQGTSGTCEVCKPSCGDAKWWGCWWRALNWMATHCMWWNLHAACLKLKYHWQSICR